MALAMTLSEFSWGVVGNLVAAIIGWGFSSYIWNRRPSKPRRLEPSRHMSLWLWLLLVLGLLGSAGLIRLAIVTPNLGVPGTKYVYFASPAFFVSIVLTLRYLERSWSASPKLEHSPSSSALKV